RAIDQMMPVRNAGAKSGAIAGAQHGFAVIRHQHGHAGQDLDEFVFMRVPMALRRPGARLEPDLVDAKLGQAGCVAEAPRMPPATRFIHRRGITAFRDFGDFADCKAGHELFPGEQEGKYHSGAIGFQALAAIDFRPAA
ncbi:MAG: hypothetical protein ACI82N_000544, partial [Maricaulis sp.]